jgi:hypothetical protein
MVIKVDQDVQDVIEFMQTRVAAHKLVGVANGLASLAPLLWDRYEQERVQIVEAEGDPIPLPPHTQSVAI